MAALPTQAQTAGAPSDIAQITATLMDYIEGTANGEPDRLKRAFHPDFKLYTVTESDSLRIRSGEKYISDIKPGEKANRIGRIISIDYEKDAAMAKAEIITNHQIANAQLANQQILNEAFCRQRRQPMVKLQAQHPLDAQPVQRQQLLPQAH